MVTMTLLVLFIALRYIYCFPEGIKGTADCEGTWELHIKKEMERGKKLIKAGLLRSGVGFCSTGP